MKLTVMKLTVMKLTVMKLTVIERGKGQYENHGKKKTRKNKIGRAHV